MEQVPVANLTRTHLRIGWYGLLVFTTLGGVLEGLHAFKSGAYLGLGNETRRLMWTLAHAHGIGLSLLNVAFAVTLKLQFETVSPSLRLASRLLTYATILLPAGFFLGGIVTYESDPGPFVLLTPIGAMAVWMCIALVASSLRRSEK